MNESSIKTVPKEIEERRRIRAEAARAAAAFERRRPPRRDELEKAARELIRRLDLSPAFLGFVMVAVNNEFWRDQFAAVPPARRVLLLPHCLRRAAECKGSYDARGLSCAGCGACVLAGLKAEAEALGYVVLIAEGTPLVVECALRGQADAILGMACLDSLEKAFPPITALGIPHVGVPLLGDGCTATTAEVEILLDWLRRQGEPRAGASATRSYLPELRAAALLFEGGALDELLAGLTENEKARRREGEKEADPSQGTEMLALEWLRAGGKRFRPFITLASHAAASGAAWKLQREGSGGRAVSGGFSPAVRRVAVAIEALHKASLVHDDIEDDDSFRYGRETLHRRCGVAAALNVGDYLIGLGYRLVASAREELGHATAADVLARLSEAHMTLCRGQGEEILWARRDPLAVRPEDVQRIYALKTAPAFEAALYAGVRTAERNDMDRARAETLRRFCRFVGVAYQLLNDLKDWNGDRHDKLIAGQDSLATRPTMLLALALEEGDPAPFRELATASKAGMPREVRLGRLKKLYEERGAFEKVRKLVEKYRRRAGDETDDMQPEAMRELMRFIVEIVL